MKSIDNQIEKSKRFVEVMNRFDLSQHDMAIKTGLSQPKVSEIKNLKAGSNILNDIFYRLHYEFGISKEWWDSGKGPMLKESSTLFEKNLTPQEPSEKYGSEYWKDKYIALQEKYTAVLEGKLFGDKSPKAG